MHEKIKLLFVDDEKKIRDLFSKVMQSDTLIVKTAKNGDVALKKLKRYPADIVFTDMRMPGMNGLQLLNAIKVNFPDIFVVVLTAFGSIEEAVEAMKSGAYDYIVKPFDFESIFKVIRKIAGHRELLIKNDWAGIERRKGYRFENIIGQDPKMFEIFTKIEDVAKTNATVLVTGESGTGKELIADALHHKSDRRACPLIKVNCAALTETLINSELFGHEKGAFTGAQTRKKGHFEMADTGTIFLDEIGDVPLSTQTSLLRVLESGTFQRVGGLETIRVNTRVICATNKDLSIGVEKNTFREDLYYRINVVPLHIPPLRERRSDIPLLVNHFRKKYCRRLQKNVPRISSAAMNLLVRYDWPGNIRELANVIENTVIFCKRREITPDNLPTGLKESVEQSNFTLELDTTSLPVIEATMIRKVLEETSWNMMQAAKELDIARGTLYSKIKKYGIKNPFDSSQAKALVGNRLHRLHQGPRIK